MIAVAIMNTIANPIDTRIESGASRVLRPGLAHERAFLLTGAFLFAASVAGTVYLCGYMSAGMPMPGGWNMSMAWMRAPGQTWFGAASWFMGMWMVMMTAMMLPSLVSMLMGHRRPESIRLPRAFVIAGYFFVWAVFGAIAYPIGVAFAAAEMRWSGLARLVPIATGVVLLLSGCVQLSRWKVRHLEHCRSLPGSQPSDVWGAWRRGMHLGVQCSLCCLAFMIILLVGGVMNLGLMAILTAAITVERLPAGRGRTSVISGFIIIASAVFVIVRALSAA